eukprot:11287973-Ditylum_brightwellii.AAC.1
MPTPYRSGYPANKIPTTTNLPQTKLEIRLDIATITNILSPYMHTATPSHVAAAKYAVKYLKGNKHLGTKFSTYHNAKISMYIDFPIANSVTALTNAN